MINFNTSPKKYTKTVIETRPNQLKVVTKISMNIFFFMDHLKQLLIINAFIVGSIYIGGNYEKDFPTSFVVIPNLMWFVFHLFILMFFSENTLILYPYKQLTQIKGKNTKWPADYELGYEKRYDENNKLIEVILKAKATTSTRKSLFLIS